MRVVAIGVLVSLLAAPALADDLYPPDWRGLPGTTFQHWTFDTNQNPYWVPEASNNPYGQPNITTFYEDEQWFDFFEGRHGVMDPWWNDVYIELPNVPDPNDWKLIYIQITYWGGNGNFPQYMGSEPPGQVIPGDPIPLEGGWVYQNWEIWIPGNPPIEWVYFTSGTTDLWMDQIVVDTWCIPEPASLMLIGLAGLLLRRR